MRPTQLVAHCIRFCFCALTHFPAYLMEAHCSSTVAQLESPRKGDDKNHSGWYRWRCAFGCALRCVALAKKSDKRATKLSGRSFWYERRLLAFKQSTDADADAYDDLCDFGGCYSVQSLGLNCMLILSTEATNESERNLSRYTKILNQIAGRLGPAVWTTCAAPSITNFPKQEDHY